MSSTKDFDEAPYRPELELEAASTAADTTPSTRAMVTSIPRDAKDRVDTATRDLTGARCLITDVDCPDMVDYAHVLARAKEKEVMMDRLEYAWGLKYRTQSIDTRQNIFRLSAKFHRLFDAKKWLLLPDISIVDQYYNARKSRKIPDIQEKVFSYTLVAHPDMKYVPIHRHEASDYRKFIYPFEEFPPIVSHVHPRFVICDAADKLRGFADVLAFGRGRLGVLPTMLHKVGQIYKAWRTAIPEPEFYEERVELGDQSERTNQSREVKAGVSYTKFFITTIPPTPPPSRSRDQPSRSVGKIPQDTPGKRVLDDGSIPVEAKLRVDKVAPKRCVLENTDESNPLDYAHILPTRRSIDGILTALEYSWRMDYASLNVDTRCNIFRLNPSLHRMFDAEAWLLLPEKDIIERYHGTLKDEPQDLPSLEKARSTYTYTLIAMNDMINVPIHVQCNKPSEPEDKGTMNDVIDNEESLSDNIDFSLEDAFTAHTFPFHQFPEIRSHIHPRFVICNSGAKLVGTSLFGFSEGQEYLEEDLIKLFEIYKAWTKPCLPSDFPTQKTLRPNKPAGDFPDDQTEYGRLPLPPNQPKRIFPHLDGDSSPKPEAKRAKSGGANDSVWLDDATLGELNQDSSPKKAWQDKLAWIQSWVGQVPLNVTVEEVPMDIDLADKLTHHTDEPLKTNMYSNLYRTS